MKTNLSADMTLAKHRRTLYSSTSAFSIGKRSSDIPTTMSHYHYHDSYELYYLCSGSRYYFIKDKPYHIKEGAFILINKYDIHYTTTSDNTGYERFLINFDEDFLSDILATVEDVNLLDCFKKDARIIELDEKDRLFAKNLLETILYEYTAKNTGYNSYIKALMLQLLLFISRHQNPSMGLKPDYINSSHKIISKITGYINNNFNDDITLNDLSEKYYISPYHLSRTFKKISGLSFVEYLNNVRIKEAQKLLRRSDLTIAQISEAVGYKSNTHFGRVFKKITGTSPLSFRNK